MRWGGRDEPHARPLLLVRRRARPARNRGLLVGVTGSGNRSLGRYHQHAAREIATRSGRPVLLELELPGTPGDVAQAQRVLADLAGALAHRHAS
ncbi:class Ib ribonucleoside-diphosphate reductase assembly flavoprotein NrdI [Cellulomonas sp. JZ18]|uniref:class Ib ribonucleoside-diphosphate reductase assembly flavoprotein NrdI n=1 Tax=Cellulomonas sp. JZ18 TaxID=2654191 RepID=UPI0021084FFB|nr:class Ib ribonucleoside-diphosphate reductase assembly flavoprotein NrdI [Cellulomonas sp. JZ18]